MVSDQMDEKPQLDIYSIALKLAGEIDPVGETRTDNERFENLKTLCRATEKLVAAIGEVGSRNRDSHQYSVKRAADYAQKFMNDLGIKDCGL